MYNNEYNVKQKTKSTNLIFMAKYSKNKVECNFHVLFRFT